MAHIIVGHTTETGARILVRGDNRRTRCAVTVRLGDTSVCQRAECFPHNDYVASVVFEGLAPGRAYEVEAIFDPGGQRVTGGFRTFPRQTGDHPPGFSFILSSCNLSVVSINNFVALLMATAGVSAGMMSLESPLDRWRVPSLMPLRRLWRGALKVGLFVASSLVKRETGLKQPGPPFIRSPFLKLAAVFDSRLVEVCLPAKGRLPAVGDVVHTASARAVVACLPSVRPDPDAKKEGDPGTPYLLVLTQVEGVLDRNAVLQRVVNHADVAVGRILRVCRPAPWFDAPSFFVHAGDQIYYDFPEADRAPDTDEYMLAYREAWFEDEANRYLLSHWSHYMTLDDHEIADQFANDFEPPHKESATGRSSRRTSSPEDYRREARAAYLEYVDALNPPSDDAPRAKRKTGAFWYTFDKGAVHFFVMDTRTQRRNGEGPRREPAQIIDAEQMKALCDWMLTHRNDLKFIVTSVPFVAEINEDRSSHAPRWVSQAPATPRRASDGRAKRINDKWCAPQFQRQRDAIIEFIATHRIEYLAFLTGDMHCCYHATMRIGGTSAYDGVTVHELAGGPANQLQLASIDEFIPACTRRTKDGLRFDIVLERFHGEASAVLHLKVSYRQRDQVVVPDGCRTPDQPLRPSVPLVEWSVIRTLTSNDASEWMHTSEQVMQGRIEFALAKAVIDLQPW